MYQLKETVFIHIYKNWVMIIFVIIHTYKLKSMLNKEVHINVMYCYYTYELNLILLKNKHNNAPFCYYIYDLFGENLMLSAKKD